VRDGSGILSFFFKKERYSAQPDPDGVYAAGVTPKNKFKQNKIISLV
jgi:hypothetical protein